MIDINLIPIKYITGTYRYDESYPTADDLMWDLVAIGKKSVSLDSIDWIETEVLEPLLDSLAGKGYIKNANNRITILKTDWDGQCDK